jgi:adenine-specific DNA-methyltransferase
LNQVRVTEKVSLDELKDASAVIWRGDALACLRSLPQVPIFDLVVTSPPYNIGKPYEDRRTLKDYVEWQSSIIREISPRLKPTGSLCWQVGNHISNGAIVPLDIELHPEFNALGLQLRNRIVWHFGHGLHSKKRFSGRYEVILWYTKTKDYCFNLDSVRVESKYPGKKYYKGPKVGQYSSNPLGKNPSDVWDIPNVKSNHEEKTAHPCQFPVGLVERLVLALTNPGDLVFDPFSGVSSAGVAALVHGRRYFGAELLDSYIEIAKRRLDDAIAGKARYRPHEKPVFDHKKSPLSKRPTDIPSTETRHEDESLPL